MDELRKVESADDWTHLHAIRRKVLFDTGIMPFSYDENHPDDRVSGNVPYLLKFDQLPIGVVRLDTRGTICTVRILGISEQYQRYGHGRALSALIDATARSSGVRFLRVNAASGSVGFYKKTGWLPEIWDEEANGRLPPGTVQMTKLIG